MAKQRTIHVLRAPLPWRPSRLTECGQLAKDDAIAPCGKELPNRFAATPDQFCKTCRERVRFQLLDSPIEREMAWTRHNQKHDRFIDFELQAIGELVARYQGEFDRLVAALQVEHSLRKAGG